MKGVIRVLVLTSLAVMLATGPAMAAGFGIYEWGARGNAMGGAVSASPKDASAIAYNPAGMTKLEGSQMMIGVSAITPTGSMDFDNYDDPEQKVNTFLPPHAYFTHQLTDKWWVGVGAFSRFGLGTEWDEEWAGRYNVTEAAISTISVNPNLAYKLNDKWSFSVGGELMWMEFLQRKVVDHDVTNTFNGGKNNPATSHTDTDAKLLGDSIGVGLTLGVTHSPLDWLTLGLSYRSQMKHKIQGDTWFHRTGSQPGLIAAYQNNTTAEGVIILPDSVTGGIAIDATDKLTLTSDVIWTRWSTYQELRIKYGAPLVGNVSESATVKGWHDTMRYCFGAEYAFNDWLDLRAGFIYDESPIEDERADYMLPTNDRKLYTLGTGFHWDDWKVDLSYMYLTSKGREYVNSNTEDGILAGNSKDLETQIWGLSLGYTF